jgi:hypothetical protein
VGLLLLFVGLLLFQFANLRAECSLILIIDLSASIAEDLWNIVSKEC